MPQRRLTITPRARRELNEATDWYEAQRPGLGELFAYAFRTTTAGIVSNPFQYQKFGRRLRRAGLLRFPYGLMYAVSNDEIVIVACFHGSRDPIEWTD